MATTTQSSVAQSGMLIRRPVAEVFNAFIDPAVTTHFWFTKSTGKLEKGKEVIWTWEMYNVASAVQTVDIIPNKKIEIRWFEHFETNTGDKGARDAATRVVWTFTPYGNDQTFVEIVNDGFSGDAASVQQQALDSTGGFCWVLAGLKAYLEHQLELNLVGDRFPTGKPGQN
ncbi:SRPBCC family protein [Chitinophaga qingshengii]|uniref:SRPBCC family protein n=1 Tax=Chitinophaga qingshengii TaxID=1569794 RepID=A0ABR7TVH0_9BACT|nr:SRPBCC family protein [Chitinophaga qingshengii]MBC9934486.1 SRPBCC family protein [Chitinophaga qingshengii]